MPYFTPYVKAYTDPLTRPITGYAQGGGVAPNPDAAITALFAASEQGAWYDPSDFSTMFQDAAGTTPVTAVGQPVGRIKDKSGRGNHATQATSAARPVLQQDGAGKYYLAFDGVDDFIETSGATWTADMDILLGAQNSGACVSVHGATAIQFVLVAEASSTSASSIASNSPINYVNGTATTDQTRGALASAWPVSTNAIIESQGADLLTSWGGGLRLGYYQFFAGFSRMYGLILREGMTPTQLTDVRNYIAGKTGVTL